MFWKKRKAFLTVLALNIARQNFFIYQQISVLKNKKGAGRMGFKQVTGLFPMENTFGQGKDLFNFSFTVSLQYFSNKWFSLASEPKKYHYSCNSVCSCHQISFIWQCIFPISQSAFEYPSSIHAAIIPSTNQQSLAKFSSILQMMAWSQHDSCFCAHTVLQK